MRVEQKGIIKNSISRIIFVGLAVLAQVSWLIAISHILVEYYTVASVLVRILAVILAIGVYDNSKNAMFKLSWIIVILSLPVFGICIYLLFGHKDSMRFIIKKFDYLAHHFLPYKNQDENIMLKLGAEDEYLLNQSKYIKKYSGYPLYQNTDVEFFPETRLALASMLKALEEAKEYIFMEYYAIEEAKVFEQISPILKSKVKQGLDIRIIYDDVGSVGFIDPGFIRRMEAIGVKCRVFNPVHPIFNIFMNNRDHRKICVIDGIVGFTGGYNIADKYFSDSKRYGHWKDSGIKLTGDAVLSLTVMFLEMWSSVKDDEDYGRFLKKREYKSKEDGFVQVYADSPLDEESVSENAYLNLIKSAKYSVFISTPYLIISDEMIRELNMAAQRGLDVRIVTPGIPDKRFIYGVTKSYYSSLVKSGIRIYKYSPGFLHQKGLIVDGRAAIVGTVNFDYRSLYHNFEDAVLLYKYKAIDEMYEDFIKLLEVSEEVSEKYKDVRRSLNIIHIIYRLIAPLL